MVVVEGVPPDLKAKTLVNRAAAQYQLSRMDLAWKDTLAVLEMPDAPPDAKATAQKNLVVIRARLQGR